MCGSECVSLWHWYLKLGFGIGGVIHCIMKVKGAFSLGDSGEALDRREVPAVQLCRTAGKNGGNNLFPRSFWVAVALV